MRKLRLREVKWADRVCTGLGHKPGSMAPEPMRTSILGKERRFIAKDLSDPAEKDPQKHPPRYPPVWRPVAFAVVMALGFYCHSLKNNTTKPISKPNSLWNEDRCYSGFHQTRKDWDRLHLTGCFRGTAWAGAANRVWQEPHSLSTNNTSQLEVTWI